MTGIDPDRDPFEALGDPNRRAIVELLGERGRPVGELADQLPISRPAVSRHLRLLKNAGLVAEEPDGTRRIYRLREDGVQALRAFLTRVWGQAGELSPSRGGHPARSRRYSARST